MKLTLRRHPGKDTIIRVIDPSGKDCGNIDIKTARGYARLLFSELRSRMLTILIESFELWTVKNPNFDYKQG